MGEIARVVFTPLPGCKADFLLDFLSRVAILSEPSGPLIDSTTLCGGLAVTGQEQL